MAATGMLELKRAGVHTHVSGRVVVNEEGRTSASHVWAAGHAVLPGGSLAEHAAQAELAAHNLFSGFLGRRRTEPSAAPAVIRTTPPIARVGATETDARARFSDVITATAQDESCLVKIVGRRRGGKLLGALPGGQAGDDEQGHRVHNAQVEGEGAGSRSDD